MFSGIKYTETHKSNSVVCMYMSCIQSEGTLDNFNCIHMYITYRVGRYIR